MLTYKASHIISQTFEIVLGLYAGLIDSVTFNIECQYTLPRNDITTLEKVTVLLLSGASRFEVLVSQRKTDEMCLEMEKLLF